LGAAAARRAEAFALARGRDGGRRREARGGGLHRRAPGARRLARRRGRLLRQGAGECGGPEPARRAPRAARAPGRGDEPRRRHLEALRLTVKLVVLDRDGVINFDSDQYIKSPAEWRPIPGSIEAIARLNQTSWRVA